jgi:hypothetical protein
MTLRRSFEKSEVRFIDACTVEHHEPSRILIAGRDSGGNNVGVGVDVIGPWRIWRYGSGGGSFLRDERR